MIGNPYRTLCPAPQFQVGTWPKQPAPAGKGFGFIIFDTYVDTSIPASEALVFEDDSMKKGVWWIENQFGAFGLGFEYEKPEDGGATKVAAIAKKCRSKVSEPGKGKQLDGDRVAPNKDNIIWSF